MPINPQTMTKAQIEAIEANLRLITTFSRIEQNNIDASHRSSANLNTAQAEVIAHLTEATAKLIQTLPKDLDLALVPDEMLKNLTRSDNPLDEPITGL
jgi:DNA phosphorothioation-dependent restriction protein DptG